MKIGEVAARAGVTTKAVRYYESLGLLAPARLSNGYRDYGEHEVRLVREVCSLHQLGIPVERTRPFLECLATGRDHVDDCPASLATYRDTIAELTTRIEALTAMRAALLTQLRQAAYRTSGTPNQEETSTTVTDLSQIPADLPVPEDDGAADHLAGSPAPHLSLPSTSKKTVTLDELGPGRSVLYVYPLTGRPDVDLPEGWDTIPGARGCSAEACGFRDHHDELLDAGASRVFGVSAQDSGYQQEVVARLRLPFALLSDTELRLVRELNLPTFQAGGRTLFKRLTLVIADGVIEHAFYPVFPPNEHAQQVLTWLRSRPHTAPRERSQQAPRPQPHGC